MARIIRPQTSPREAVATATIAAVALLILFTAKKLALVCGLPL